MLGKIVGGGLPVAPTAAGDIMQKVMPAGPVFQAGTLSGNPLAMAAGLATLQELRRPPYARFEQLGKLADGSASRARKPACRINWRGRQHVDAVLQRRAGHGLRHGQEERHEAYSPGFFWAMMDRGVYLPCSQFEAAFLSTYSKPMWSRRSRRPWKRCGRLIELPVFLALLANSNASWPTRKAGAIHCSASSYDEDLSVLGQLGVGAGVQLNSSEST